MQRKLHAGIERYLNAAQPYKARLTVKDVGDIRIVGKASTISRQLADIADLYSQDVFVDEPIYSKGVSFK